MGKASVTQQRIMDFIEKFTKENKYPPSVREIGAAVGLRSPSTVHMHIKALVTKGSLIKDANKTRALVLSETVPDGVPIIGKVTAGAPILAFEEPLGILAYKPPDDGDYFALEVRGDSMSGIGIIEGDFVVVRKQQTARNGQVVVAIIDDEATVKRLKRDGGRIWLMPENPDYSPISGDTCNILGVVSSLVREEVF